MKLPESVKGLLRTFAPTVVAALSGPFAPLAAGLVTAALKQWLPEGTERATPAQIVQAVDANVGNAALLADLKAAEKALTDAEKDLGFRFAELEQKDRSDARAFVRDTGLARAQFIAGMLLVGIALFMLFGIVVGCVLAVMGTINVDPVAVADHHRGVRTYRHDRRNHARIGRERRRVLLGIERQFRAEERAHRRHDAGLGRGAVGSG